MTVSELCQSCGLCCRGALFRYAALTGEEALRLERVGIPSYVRRDGRCAMRLPCPGLAGTQCSLYETRPRACDAYFCEVVFRLRDGRLTAEQAQEIVSQARALVEEVAAALPAKQQGDPESEFERAHLHGLAAGPEPLRRAEAVLQDHFL